MSTKILNVTESTFDTHKHNVQSQTEHLKSVETINDNNAHLRNIETVALVVSGPKAEFTLQPITLDEIRDDEVLVEMKYSGICSLVFLHGILQAANSYQATPTSYSSKAYCQW
jgi:hypothetical protein